mgnify:CR=1 FL=1
MLDQTVIVKTAGDWHGAVVTAVLVERFVGSTFFMWKMLAVHVLLGENDTQKVLVLSRC